MPGFYKDTVKSQKVKTPPLGIKSTVGLNRSSIDLNTKKLAKIFPLAFCSVGFWVVGGLVFPQ